MRKEEVKNLSHNFNINNWSNLNQGNEKQLVYNDDSQLTLRLEGRHTRGNDDALNMTTYDNIFDKYNISYIISARFYYNENCIEGCTITLLENGHTLIPNPVGANMINKFYKNEVNIAKAFSDSNFDRLMGEYEIYADHPNY